MATPRVGCPIVSASNTLIGRFLLPRMPRLTTLSPAAKDKAMASSVVEGACYAVMVGFGESYFVANNVRLGASVFELGLLIALPLCLGAIGPLLALRALARGASRRRITVVGTTGQAASLATIVACDQLSVLEPSLLIGIVCLYQAFGQGTGVVWSSWFGDLVPVEIRGQYFARRNRVVHGTTCASVLAAGMTLQFLEPGAAGDVARDSGGTGYLVILGIAATARIVSMLLLSRTPDAGVPRAATSDTFWSTTRSHPPEIRRLAAFVFGLNLVVYVASPYFDPHMLDDLSFGYFEYTIAAVSIVGTKILVLSRWGALVDQLGGRMPLLLALVGITLTPVPWFFAEGLPIVIFAQMLSGASWAGHELSQFSMILEVAPSARRPHVFALLNIVSGLAQLIGSMIGAALMHLSGGQFVLVLAVSVTGRALVTAIAPALLATVAQRAHLRRRQVLLRLVGFRPSGGVTHRPIATPDEDDGPPDA